MLFAHETSATSELAPLFGQREIVEPIPRYRLPEREMPARTAYQLIHDELMLDGNPLLNLASFVTTWMEPEADELIAETVSKNFVDQDEYPQTAELERRCVSILADLFHASSTGDRAFGTSTIGSSEAIHLCGLALQRKWRARRRAEGLATDRPNLVSGSHVHVVWEKFCRYFDVEHRVVPLEAGRYQLDVERAAELADENTIGVVAVLGSTFTGHFDDVAGLDRALAERGGPASEVPIHVDAASGGFVAPFAYPELQWDFRVERVRSINVSGHKYGLVYPGVGWAVWRDRSDLPSELVFYDNYLGADQLTFDLNFSKSASPIVGQYYNFIRLGQAGYRRIIANLLRLTAYLAELVSSNDQLEILSGPDALPVVCCRLVDDIPFTEHDVALALRRRGWIVPAYTMPSDLDAMSVLRVVVREGFSRDLAEKLVADLESSLAELTRRPPETPVRRVPDHFKVC